MPSLCKGLGEWESGREEDGNLPSLVRREAVSCEDDCRMVFSCATMSLCFFTLEIAPAGLTSVRCKMGLVGTCYSSTSFTARQLPQHLVYSKTKQPPTRMLSWYEYE